ncbi:hypothetical protein BGAL_0072g00070 [Botrytis galanthina]|uniref:Uncharacterized protein n=1 Tax=Botrytis galanthina TaxID=278940 RepID=A0A4S8R6C0_9HELO|nr:hypothetical protein BGAL_0072g00070 [Botrytis galanthina]
MSGLSGKRPRGYLSGPLAKKPNFHVVPAVELARKIQQGGLVDSRPWTKDGGNGKAGDDSEWALG